jgi:hypothetical protein
MKSFKHQNRRKEPIAMKANEILVPSDASPLRASSQTRIERILETAGKSLVVGILYALVVVLGGALARATGLSVPGTDDPMMRLFWAFVGGVIAGLTIGPIASSVPVSRTRHIMIWASLIFFNVASVVIEGTMFAPVLLAGALPALLFVQMVAALATGGAISVLFAPREPAILAFPVHRSFLSWTWRFVTSALVYPVFYFVFGAINYALVTGPYYRAHAGGLVVPVAATVMQAEIVRGALIAISVLAFLVTVRTSKMRRALLTGWLLFAVGGLVPLTMQVGTLPLILLTASAVEIFFQNFSTGVVASLLLGMSE